MHTRIRGGFQRHRGEGVCGHAVGRIFVVQSGHYGDPGGEFGHSLSEGSLVDQHVSLAELESDGEHCIPVCGLQDSPSYSGSLCALSLVLAWPSLLLHLGRWRWLLPLRQFLKGHDVPCSEGEDYLHHG